MERFCAIKGNRDMFIMVVCAVGTHVSEGSNIVFDCKS